MEKTQKRDRIRALERFQQGESVSTIANSLGYSRRWVYKWIERSRVASPEVPGQRIDPDVRMLTPGTVRSKWWKP